jgi:Secretion system C-terminal sorting domain
MKKKFTLLSLATILAMLIVNVASAQNQVYWREGFEPSATPACDLTTVAPTATGGKYFAGNAGSWYGFNIYRTTGTGCPAGNNHVRYKNIAGVTDSGYLVTPVVNFGIKEFHMYRARASRSYTIWSTNDTLATTTNWTMVVLMKSSASTITCNDTLVPINLPTAKRLKIVGRPGTDTDVDSIWLTSFSAILPIKFNTISAIETNNLVKLTFGLASETGAVHYNIEKSLDGNVFTSIAKLDASKAASYNYIDANPNNGNNFYRVKATDNNGNINYSSVITINLTKGKTGMQIAPNPVKGNQMNLQLLSANKGDYKVRILNINGTQVYTTNIVSEGGSLSKLISLPSTVSSGTYIVEVNNGITKFNKLIIVE